MYDVLNLFDLRKTEQLSTSIRSPASKKLKVNRQPPKVIVKRKRPNMGVPNDLRNDFTPNTPSTSSAEYLDRSSALKGKRYGSV